MNEIKIDISKSVLYRYAMEDVDSQQEYHDDEEDVFVEPDK